MTAMSSGEPIVLTDPGEIIVALESSDLVPHRSGDARDGATNRLRASMARFSGPAEHAPRRRAVVDAIAAIDPEQAHGFAEALTVAQLTGEPLDGIEIAGTVPTAALASCLALPASLDAIVADMLAIVRVIGRGAPSSPESDAATERMLALCSDRADGGVPTVSILYQNFDATWSLLTTTLQACATRVRAVPAVPRTRRVAAADIEWLGRSIPAGTDFLLEIGQAELPFGAGPHQCPGQALAEAIVAGILAAIDATPYRVDPSGIVTDADGRPTALPMSVS
jgi:cytochrome P450